MYDVPSSTALETAGYMLWMLIEPFEATLRTYDPWTVAFLALALSFIPLPRTLTYLKVLGAALTALGIATLSPIMSQLTPVWPDAYAAETYIQFGLYLIEATVIIGILQAMSDVLKGAHIFAPSAKTAKKAHGPFIVSPAGMAFDATDKMSLNFKQHVATPVSFALTQTLSVPRTKATKA